MSRAVKVTGGLLLAIIVVALLTTEFDFDTLAVQAHRLASDERLNGAAVPSLVIVACAALGMASPAHAAPGAPAFELEGLPAHLSARVEHVPKPMPEDGDLQFQRSGPSARKVVAG